MDSIDFTGRRIAKIAIKTNNLHCAQFRFYDDYDKIIGKTIYSKYDENSDDEFEVEIAPDEKLIGFHVRQANWVDCKTAKIAFKIAKAKNVDQQFIQQISEYKKKQKLAIQEISTWYPRNTAFCLERWDPVGYEDVKFHYHASGWKETVI